jgi:type IV secretion system protein VirB10
VDGPEVSEAVGAAEPEVTGERGISSIHRGRSLQSRITNLLAAGLMSALGLGLLGWYYAHTFAAESAAHRSGQAALQRQASGTVPLPPLGPLHEPAAVPPGSSLMASTLGPPPALPSAAAADPVPVAGFPEGDPGYGVPVMPAAGTLSPRQLALARELSGPAFDTSPTNTSSASASPGGSMSSSEVPPLSGGPPSPAGFPGTSPSTGGLGALLTPTITRAARPSVLPTRRLLLPKGAFIDCTLETVIDSTLPGMTTCITATDTFGADGTVVLLPRGTELVGETRGQVEQGASRLFVLWTEARTPGGVVIPLDSPGTDALGRSGLTGTVNRHFWQRFGAAILISVINGGIQYGVQSQNQGGALVYEPDTTESVMTEALKSTVDIPPTITVKNGARIQVLVARNIDFRSVYALRPTGK